MEVENIDYTKKILIENGYRLREQNKDHFLVILNGVSNRVKRKIGFKSKIVATIYGNQIYGVERARRTNQKHQKNIANLLKVEFI